MTHFLNILKERMSQFDPKLYYNGFYDAYQYQKRRNYPYWSNLIISLIAVVSLVLTVFSVVVIAKSKKIRRTYQLIILEHVALSTLMCLVFPITDANIIANYGVVFMKKWSDSPNLPFLVFGIQSFGYMGVLVTCFHSFVLNVIWSTNYQFDNSFFKKFQAESVVNAIFVIYEVITSIVYFFVVTNFVVTESEDIVRASLLFDPRLQEIYKEKSVATIIVTKGFVVLISIVFSALIVFLAASAFLISLNYKIINKRKTWSSITVQKQQRTIILMETLYFLMTLTCFLPSCTTLLLSVFMNYLPEEAKKYPIFLLVALPLQLLPIFDCLLHIYAIRVHRETAKGMLCCQKKRAGASDSDSFRDSSVICVTNAQLRRIRRT